MAKGPERLVRWIMGHTQPVPYSLDIEHPAMDDIAWAADEIERLQAELRADMERIVALEQQNEALASRLGAAEKAMREVVSHLQRSQRGSTHWAGCPDVHPACQAINMLVDALALESRDVETPDAGDALRRVLNDPEAMERVMDRATEAQRETLRAVETQGGDGDSYGDGSK